MSETGHLVLGAGCVFVRACAREIKGEGGVWHKKMTKRGSQNISLGGCRALINNTVLFVFQIKT